MDTSTALAAPAPLAPALHRLLLAATAAGILGAGTALLGLLRPAASPLALMAAPPPLVAVLGIGPMHAAQLLAALLTTAVALHQLRAPVPSRPLLLGAAGLALLVPGLALASMGTLSHTGYLVALAVPVLAVLAALALVRRGGAARWAVGVPALAALAGGAVLGRELLAALLSHLLPALAGQMPAIGLTALSVGTGAIWAGIGLLALRDTPAGRRLAARVLRHRRAWTILAACGPLPYALARATWLTPWPVFGGEMAAADPTVRLWGLALSSGCWLGALLTIGLIRPWGETFPRWFPGVGGRPVPVALAAVPGLTVAALLCFAAVPVVLAGFGLGPGLGIAFALLFPCWIWGPSLALAVAGYVAHRRAQARAPRPLAAASGRMAA